MRNCLKHWAAPSGFKCLFFLLRKPRGLYPFVRGYYSPTPAPLPPNTAPKGLVRSKIIFAINCPFIAVSSLGMGQ